MVENKLKKAYRPHIKRDRVMLLMCPCFSLGIGRLGPVLPQFAWFKANMGVLDPVHLNLGCIDLAKTVLKLMWSV